MRSPHYIVEPIGLIRSELTRLEEAPMQGDEGAPDAWLELTPRQRRDLWALRLGTNSSY
jgi:hypothetical protein